MSRPPGRTRRMVEAGELEFRVIESGPAAGPAFVLIHGIGMSHRYLSRLHEVLSATHPVFSIDLPGFAGLRKPGRDIDVEQMGAALADLIAVLDVGPVVLVGHSMGAQWVVEAAGHRPDVVAHVVIIGPVADAAHRSLSAQTVGLVLDSLGEPPSINAIVFSDYLRCGPFWYLAQVRHMLGYPLEERVAELSMPLLVMRGGQDPIAGIDWCRSLRGRAAASALIEIPGHHHVAQHSAPRAVASAIRAYTAVAAAPTP